jgi:phage terminase large subunit-like protein
MDTTEADALDRLAAWFASKTDDEVRDYLTNVVPSLGFAARRRIERCLGHRLAVGVRAEPFTLAQHIAPECEAAGVPSWPMTVRDWRYVRYLSRQIADTMTNGGRLCISLPAQVGKSFWLRLGSIWRLDARPDKRIIYLSYGDVQADEAAFFMREVVRAAGPKLSFDLRQDAQARDRWVTNQGGGILATGIGGGVAGFGGSVIVDDPLKNWQEAHSPARREYVWNELRAVISLRLAEDDFLIVCHTRWHKDDPTGKLESFAKETGEPWKFVRLPMTAEDNDPIGRMPGEVLEPERYSIDAVASRKALLGNYLWTALEQQRPAEEEGRLVKRAWWRWSSTPIAEADEWLTSTDTKMKDRKGGSYVVTQVWGRVGNTFHCVDQMRGQWSQAHARVAIALMQVRHPQVNTHLVENAGYGPEMMEVLREGDAGYVLSDDMAGELGIRLHERAPVEQVLRDGLAGLIPVTPKGSKEVRARAVTPLIEAGNVYLPENTAWAEQFVDEWASFPEEPNDIVDTASMALARLRQGDTQTATPPQAPLPPQRPMRSMNPLASIPKH